MTKSKKKKGNSKKECKIEPCHRPVRSNGYCKLHNDRVKQGWKLSKKLNHIENLMRRTCCIGECDNPRFSHNLCNTHFHQVMDKGRPEWLPGEKKKYDPEKDTSSRCIIKQCKRTPKKGKICKQCTKELESLHKSRDAFKEDNEQKIGAFEVKEISLDEVDFEDETFKMRQQIDDWFLQELARSIRDVGLLHLPVYMKVPSRKKKPYRIVSGFCRTAAHKFLSSSQPSFNKVEARIIDAESFSHTELLKLAYEENDKRNYVSFLEIALKAVKLKEKQAFSNSDIGEVLDKSTNQVNRLFSVIKNAHEDVLTAVDNETISFGHAKIIISMKKADQKYWLDRIIDEKLSVKDLEEAIEEQKSAEYKESFDNFRENPPEGIEFEGSTEHGQFRLNIDFNNNWLLEKFYKEFVRKYF
ncbi:MAG: ParB/RepB/Spo0J family partition protein, partial [Flavobacteriales bacterium]